MSDTVYLNGEYLPRNKAFISADDRGFQFADGVYEVIKCYGGIPFRMEDHLQRLKNSLREIRIRYQDVDHFPAVLNRLLDVNGLAGKEAAVYVQITRGSHFRVHHFPVIASPTVYAFAFPFPSLTRWQEEGIRVVTADDIRWLRCDIKSVSLLPNTMLYQQAVEQGAGECLLVREGMITEATHSSVMGIKGGTLVTHPLSPLILPGITRKVILEICRENAIPVREEPVPLDQLPTLDEFMLTGTGSEVIPIVQVDDLIISQGVPGAVTRFLQQKFFQKVKMECGLL